MKVNTCKVIAIVAALVVLGASPPALAKWGHGPGVKEDRLDLSVRVKSRWLGHGHNFSSPSTLVVERVASDRSVTSMVRIWTTRVPDSAWLQGCGRARYVIDGVDATPQVKDGGYKMTDLEVGATKVRVIASHLPRWDVSCRIKVIVDGTVHDALTLKFVR